MFVIRGRKGYGECNEVVMCVMGHDDSFRL